MSVSYVLIAVKSVVTVQNLTYGAAPLYNVNEKNPGCVGKNITITTSNSGYGL